VDPASGSRRSHSRASAALLDLLTALAGAPAAQWLRDVPWPDGIGYHGGLAAWLVSFLGDAPEVQARLAASLTAQPDPVAAASACRAAYDVARAWRARTEEMLGLLAGCLGHPERTVRVAAIRSLASSGVVPISWDQHEQCLAAAALGRIRPPAPRPGPSRRSKPRRTDLPPTACLQGPPRSSEAAPVSSGR